MSRFDELAVLLSRSLADHEAEWASCGHALRTLGEALVAYIEPPPESFRFVHLDRAGGFVEVLGEVPHGMLKLTRNDAGGFHLAFQFDFGGSKILVTVKIEKRGESYAIFNIKEFLVNLSNQADIEEFCSSFFEAAKDAAMLYKSGEKHVFGFPIPED